MPILKPYTKSAIPKTTGTVTEYQYCENADSYKPKPASEAQSQVKAKIDAFKTELENYFTSLSRNVDAMKNHFGTDFISVDGKGLGFVNDGVFNTLIHRIKNQEIQQMETDLTNFFNACQTGEETIQSSILDQLKANSSERERQISRRDTAKTTMENLEKIKDKDEGAKSAYYTAKTTYNDAKAKVDSYVEVDPLTFGEWQK